MAQGTKDSWVSGSYHRQPSNQATIKLNIDETTSPNIKTASSGKYILVFNT